MEKRRVGRPKGSTKKRMTNAEMEDFIKASMKKILTEHLSWKQYKEYCEKYDLSEHRANHYWNICWTQIRERFDLDKEKMVSKHLWKYWNIYEEAYKSGDLTNARLTLNDIAKLQGLNEPDKLDLKTTGEIKFKFGDE